MKLTQKVMTAGAITVLSFSAALVAQERQSQAERASPQALERSSSQSEVQSQQREQQEFGARQQAQKSRKKASELKGSEVRTQGGEELGEIEDFAINLETGELSYLLVGADGGDFKPIPVQAANIQGSGDEVRISVNIDEQRWEQAPTVGESEIAQLSQPQRGREIYQFFGEDFEAHQQQQMQFGSPQRERQQQSGQSSQSGQSQSEQQQSSGQQSSQAGQSSQSGQQQSSQPGQSQSGQSSQSSSGQSAQEFGARSQAEQQQRAGQSSQAGQQQSSQAGQSQSGQQQSSQAGQSSQSGQQSAQQQSSGQSSQEFGQRSSSMQQQGQTRLGSKLMDAEIQNQQQEKVGEVEDLILNLQEGRVDFVLFDAEEEDGTFAVSPQALQASGEENLRLNISQQDLQQAQALRQQEIDRHAQQARMSGSQAQQSPQVYRWEGDEGRSAIFGTPGRDRSERESEAREQRESRSEREAEAREQSESRSDR